MEGFWLYVEGAFVLTELCLKLSLNCGRKKGLDVSASGHVAAGWFSAEGEGLLVPWRVLGHKALGDLLGFTGTASTVRMFTDLYS